MILPNPRGEFPKQENKLPKEKYIPYLFTVNRHTFSSPPADYNLPPSLNAGFLRSQLTISEKNAYFINNWKPLKTTWIILLLLLLCCRPAIYAQASWENHELFNTRRGLPNNIVLAMVQDDRNLLWIGTRNGLCIYDGYEFEIKKNIFSDNDGEWGNVFCMLFKDREGNIWVGSQSGYIGKYDVRADSVIQYTIPGKGYREYVTCCYQDRSGNIWLASNGGMLYRVEAIGRKVTRYKTPAGEQHIQFISEDAAGDLWLNGYYKFNNPRKRENARKNEQPFLKISGNNEFYICKSTGDIIPVKEHEITTKTQFVFRFTKDGRLLLATSQLVKEFDANGNLLNRIVISGNENYNNEDISHFIFEDATGIWWLGTNSGLIKIEKEKYQFNSLSTSSQYGKLNSNYVRAVFADSVHVWAGFRAGLINRLTYNADAKKYTSVSGIYKNPSSPLLSINIIRRLRSGILLIGGTAGLFYARGNEPVLHDLLLDDGKKQLQLSEVWSIYEDRNGRVWVGTRVNGLYIIDPATRKYRHYAYDHVSGRAGGLSSVWYICKDHKGAIWLATENGLDSVVLDADGYAAGFYNLHDHYNGEAGRQIWSITEDSKNRLWIGSTMTGISLVDKEQKRFITYNKNNGLPDNVVCGILADDKDHLWISTMNGISRFDIRERTFYNFTEHDGLQGSDFNFNACYRAPSGHLFFGSKTGIVSFHPDSIVKKKTSDVPVLVRAFNLGNSKYLDDPDPARPISLNHDQNSFSFRFAIPHYASPAYHQYQYMLQGFDDRWSTTGARHPIATYTNVPPGEYTLLVKGSINGQHWSSMPTMLHMVIRPAFWQQPLFRVGIVVLLVLGIAGFIYRRFRLSLAKEREKNLLNQKFAELEFRALQAQMNPHFIFNSINAIQHFMLTNDERATNVYLSKFARLMRLYLESSKNKYISLKEEIELLQLYTQLEKLRFDDKFDYTFSVDPYFEHTTLEIPSMLLQPHVENAINHGLALRSTKGWLNISFVHTPQGITCTIDDNGVGRNHASDNKIMQQQKSRGTDLIRERLSAYRMVDNIEIRSVVTDKTDDDGNAAGTRVDIFIPQIV